MSESYAEQLGRVRLMAEGNDPTWDLSRNDISSLAAVLSRLELLEGKAGKIQCIHCGTETARATPEEMAENIRVHIASCEKRPEARLTRVIYSIAVALGLEIWDDGLAETSVDAFLEAVEGSMSKRTQEAFSRGVRARDAAEGDKVEELPPSVRGAVTKALERIIRDVETSVYCLGIPHVAETAREALRVLDGVELQTGEPRKEAIGKLRCSVCNKGLATISMYIKAKDSIRAVCGDCSTVDMSERDTVDMSEREIRIREESAQPNRNQVRNADVKYLLGVIDVIREDRNRLRAKFQTGEDGLC